MIEVRWSDQSQADIFDLLSYYDDVDPELAIRIETAIISAPTLLTDYPQAGAVIGENGLRKWNVPKLPFLLLYRLVGHIIEVDRVVHHKQNWRPRP